MDIYYELHIANNYEDYQHHTSHHTKMGAIMKIQEHCAHRGMSLDNHEPVVHDNYAMWTAGSRTYYYRIYERMLLP